MTPAQPTPVWRLLSLLKKDKRLVGRIYLFAVVQGLVNLSLPLGLQGIIGLVQGGTPSTSWIILTVLVVFGLSAAGIFQIIQLTLVEHLQRSVFARSAFEIALKPS